MKLCIKQKVFSWKNRFTVFDEDGNERYFVEGELFSFGHKLHVFDTSAQEMIYIEQRLFTFLPKYDIYLYGQYLCQIVKEFSFFRPKYTIENKRWSIEGDYWAHEYQVCQDGKPIADISKQWFTFGDCYCLDIVEEAYEQTALALVLAIDCCMADAASAANS